MPTLTTAAGDLYYETQGSGDDVLVWLHGFGCSLRSFDDVLPLVEGHRSIAIDLPGFGRSAAAGGECHVPDLARAVLDVLDALAVERFAILGHSMGGAVALRLAVDHPERVNALIGLATQPAQGAARRPDNEALIEGFASSYGNREALAAGAASLTSYDVQAWNDQMVADMLLAHERTWLGWLRGNVFWSQEDDLKQVAVPSLFIVPGRDIVIAPDDQLRTAQAVPGARVVILNDYGHLVVAENPALVAHEISSHLNWPAPRPMT